MTNASSSASPSSASSPASTSSSTTSSGSARGVNRVPTPSGAMPYLTIRDAAKAIDFYQRAFGATLHARLDAPDGVMHAELSVHGARFMLTEERPQYGAVGPQSLNGSSVGLVVFVPDVDATVRSAEAAGARIDMPVQDQFWGDRMGQIVDPFGHKWMISTHLEDVTPEQLQQRAAAMFSQSGPCGEPGAAG